MLSQINIVRVHHIRNVFSPVCAEEKKSLGAESMGLTGVSAGNRSEFNAIFSEDGSESAEGFVSVGDFAETHGSEPYYAPIGTIIRCYSIVSLIM